MRLLALDGLIGRLVTLGLVHAVWIGLAVAAAAALVLHFRHRIAPRWCYRTALLALAIGLVGPLGTTLHQRGQDRAVTSEPTMLEMTTVAVSTTPGPVSRARPAPYEAMAPAPRLQMRRWAAERLVALLHRCELLQPSILGTWLVGVGVGLLWLMIGAVALERLRGSAGDAPGWVRERAAAIGRRMGVRHVPDVRIHDVLREPLVFGLVRPVVLLPRAWLERSDPSQLDAILAHEFAHVRRSDLLVNVVQRLIEVLLFFHPAVLWLSGRVRVERERCADALAVGVTGDAFALALALESVARARRTRGFGLNLVAALGGGDRCLLPRIQELLGMKPSSSRFRLWPIAALPCAGLLALLAASLGLAQEPAPPNTSKTQTGRADDPVNVNLPIREHVAFEFAQVPYEGPSVNVVDPLNRNFSANQINYEVRFVTQAPDSKVGIAAPHTNVQAVVADPSTTAKFLQDIQASARSNVIQAPKVTEFEDSKISISTQKTVHYVADVEPITSEDHGVAFKPEVGKILEGSSVEIGGKYTAGVAKLQVRLHDAEISKFETRFRDASAGKFTLRGQYQVPTVIERDFEETVEIPEDRTLVVSLGTYYRTFTRSGPLWKVLGLVKHLGGPALDTEEVATEKFVLITPRRIILEEEEQVLGRAVPDPKDDPILKKTANTPDTQPAPR